ncbi:hypothetical protein H8356DRAFT_1332892 [Neocallimastix lanati (nom. inval.)]|nr:hypothetical protein H8356DRAFT_1332892 [Neocallimastix sp. JGI-2020a]
MYCYGHADANPASEPNQKYNIVLWNTGKMLFSMKLFKDLYYQVVVFNTKSDCFYIALMLIYAHKKKGNFLTLIYLYPMKETGKQGPHRHSIFEWMLGKCMIRLMNWELTRHDPKTNLTKNDDDDDDDDRVDFLQTKKVNGFYVLKRLQHNDEEDRFIPFQDGRSEVAISMYDCKFSGDKKIKIIFKVEHITLKCQDYKGISETLRRCYMDSTPPEKKNYSNFYYSSQPKEVKTGTLHEKM